MITNLIRNTNFLTSPNNTFLNSSKKEDKDPILKAIEQIILSKTITEKEIKGEKLTEKEQEFKANNIVIPDPDTILLAMLDSKETDVQNSRRLKFEDKDSDNDIVKLKELLKNNA
ncbi:hypothetical protein [Paraclostridium bifermentans]|uniref:hypothetical protein n=1 Tax=Paraclostridium bifermentans TaxID=1490 RepID=UPI001FF29750|nr:hypothetical protein [Paraclostridium bifermentans]UOW69588.1 hypothetical protein MTR78_16520 [Paraclostridium bifermentans]